MYMYLAASITDFLGGFEMDHSCSLNSMKFAISEKNYSFTYLYMVFCQMIFFSGVSLVFPIKIKMFKFVSDNLMIIHIMGFIYFPILIFGSPRAPQSPFQMWSTKEHSFFSVVQQSRICYDYNNGRSDDNTPYGPLDQMGYLFQIYSIIHINLRHYYIYFFTQST